MAAVADSTAGLVVDPALHQAWSAAAPEAVVTGIAAAVAGSHGSVVVVSPTAVDDAAIAAATPGLTAALGVRSVEIVVVSGGTLSDIVRDWTYQAGQGSGRGVRVRVRTDEQPMPDDGPGASVGEGTTAEAEAGAEAGAEATVSGSAAPVRVLVRAIDSSARELAFRLGSPQEPALPALRALLGGREVSVEDEESLAID